MIPQPGLINLNFTNFVILLGVVQGLLITISGLMQPQRKAKLKGFLFFSITCIIAEIFLNRSGYMYYAIQMVDFSEPIQYAIPPLIYLVIVSLNPNSSVDKWWLHFIPFFAYMLFFLPFYFAPASYKSESYYFMHHNAEWNPTANYGLYQRLGNFRMFQLHLCFFQATVYLVLCFQLLKQYKREIKEYSVTNLFEIRWWTSFCVLTGLLLFVVLIVKGFYLRDIGDHIIASFFTFIIYVSAITELIHPTVQAPDLQFISQKSRNEYYPENPDNKDADYREEKKEEIRNKLNVIMEQQKLYLDSSVSIEKVSRQIGEPSYLVSQVINDKMNLTFYDWIARYRVEEAKLLFLDSKTRAYTIEQIAEEVGYNSKSAFNKAFRKFAGCTPSKYRNASEALN